jgi:glutathione S-transferase
MQLLASLTSPFVRQVRMAAAMKGLADTITLRLVDTGPTINAELRRENPLAKIPVLILDDGTRLYDSRVIAEYLDGLSETAQLFPAPGRERQLMLTRTALADGIKDAAVLILYESRFRPDGAHSSDWLARQQGKVDAAVDHLEHTIADWPLTPDYGHVSLAAALGYLDFRQGGRWRADHPRLVAWLERFATSVPAFAETAPPPTA